MNYIRLTIQNINTSYRKRISIYEFENFILSGQIPLGFEGQVLHLLEETPIQMIAGVVDQISSARSVKPEILWRNLALAARQIKSPVKLWDMILDVNFKHEQIEPFLAPSKSFLPKDNIG